MREEGALAPFKVHKKSPSTFAASHTHKKPHTVTNVANDLNHDCAYGEGRILARHACEVEVQNILVFYELCQKLKEEVYIS